MRIVLDIGAETRRTIRRLGAMGAHVAAALDEGLQKGAQFAAGHVAGEYLSGQYLHRRTGNLARSIEGWKVREHHVAIGIPAGTPVGRYAWLLGEEVKTITPRRSQYLAIPIGENLTKTGVARFTSPRQVEDGFFIRTGGQLLFGRKNGTRGRFRALFVLVRSVTIFGTGALGDGVEEALPEITAAMQTEVDKIQGMSR